MQGDENVRVIFGMKLRQFREQLGYTLKTLAQANRHVTLLFDRD